VLLEFRGADADVGGDRGRGQSLGAQGAEDLAEQLRGLAHDALRLGAAVAEAGQLHAGGAVAPVGDQVQLVQAVGERHRGDVPGPLRGQDAIRGGVAQALGEHAGPRHQERGGEPVSLGLRGRPGARHLVLAVQDQVSQLVGSIEPAALAGLAGAQEDERLAAPVQRVRVQLIVLRGQRVDADAVCLEQVQHVRDRSLPQPPAGTDHLRGRLGIMTGQRRQIPIRQAEPGLDPVVDADRDPARRQCPVTLTGGHLAEGTEAHRLLGDLIHIRGHEEQAVYPERAGEQPKGLLAGCLVTVLVNREAVRAQAGQLGQAGQRQAGAFPGNDQPRRCQHWSGLSAG